MNLDTGPDPAAPVREPTMHAGRRTVVPAGVSGPEFQLEIAAQSISRIFVELDWAADRKLD